MDRLTALAKIENNKGDIFKLYRDDINTFEVKEIYFSEVKYGETKGWKLHKVMTCRLLVVRGLVRFDFKEKNNVSSVTLGCRDNTLLTIEPKQWFAFTGASKETASIMNISNILHDPKETESKPY